VAGSSILSIFVVSNSYSGNLTSFFTADLAPKGPQTFDDLAKYLNDENFYVRICCDNLKQVLQESSLESYQFIFKRVSLLNYCF